MRKNATVKFWLHGTAIGIVLVLLVLAAITTFYINQILKYDEVYQKMQNVHRLELQMRNLEKDYALYDSYNQNYFETRKSKYIEQLYIVINNIKHEVTILQNDRLIQQLSLQNSLSQIEKHYNDYEQIFGKYENAIFERGFKDFGLNGKMREQIHAVEKAVEKFPSLSNHMLMLRRHEKDYQLRKDMQYVDKFDSKISAFIGDLNRKSISNDGVALSDAMELQKLLENYKFFFHKLVDQDKLIGDEHIGLIKEMNAVIVNIERLLNMLLSEVHKIHEKKINNIILIAIIISIISSIIIITLLMRLTKHITGSIKLLHKYITRLGKGELPELIVARYNDEISEMVNSINVLTTNLKNTKAFAIEVGRGNLATDINVFNNQGDLGGSLIEMRNQLMFVNKERKKAETDAERRVWETEGIAKLGEILRQYNDNIDQFSHHVLQQIINYTEVPQGGIYLISDDYKGGPCFELKASFAYNTEVEVEGVVKFGEDLISRAIIEKKAIHLEEITQVYLSISTGIIKAPVTDVSVFPCIFHGNVLCVIELGSYSKIKKHTRSFVERASADIAATFANVRINLKTKQLLVKTQEQTQSLEEKNSEIETQKENLEQVNLTISKQQEYMASNIRYAKTIQQAILPRPKFFEETFSEHFIIYKAKDVVSGDFYWVSKPEVKHLVPEELLVLEQGGSTEEYSKNHINTAPETKLDYAFMAVADCTGHGVPGAFMSLISSSLLNEIVNSNSHEKPSLILTNLHGLVVDALNQQSGDHRIDEKANNDGLDIGLCKFEWIYKDNGLNLKNYQVKITYSGAKLSLYYQPGNTKSLKKLPGDRKSIGGSVVTRNKLPFTDHQAILNKGDIIYLFTDGFVDQNNLVREKFGTNNLIELLETNSFLPLKMQAKLINENLMEFQGTEPQRDDITLIGIKL